MSVDRERVRRWIAHDPDPVTRRELENLLAADNDTELSERFAGPLSFGTAGLRGRIEAGESRMNVATVSQATWGLWSWLAERVDTPTVVVGCDARHGSNEFYTATTEILAALGCTVLALPPQHPTPLTAFAVRHFNADAGVMITASHNPAHDNGYKVYLGGRIATDAAAGVQLISPADTEIAAAIARAPYPDAIARSSEGITHVATSIVDAYLESSLRDSPQGSDLPIVVTAMHGVGGAVALRLLNMAGFTAVMPVAEQHQPNPDFPTVSFPNPEEAGALDAAYTTADRLNARLVLALDPDADRCSVAVKTGDTWRQLTGDEVGVILGEDSARRYCERRGDHQHQGTEPATMAASIVSSRLLETIAHAHGLRFVPTLTGFKWIARTPGLVFGYEEALGYCTDPEIVRDKDGMTACLRMAGIAARLAEHGRSLIDFLAEIHHRYGLHLSSPLTFRVDEPAHITAALDRLAAHPPHQLAGAQVVTFADLSEGFRGLPPTVGYWVETARNDRIVVRPSGTEPKLKCYLEVVSDHAQAATERLHALKTQLRDVLAL